MVIEPHRDKKKQKNQAEFRVGALMKQASAVPNSPQRLSNVKEINQKKSVAMTADIHGHTVLCRIDSGADEVVISDTIIHHFADNKIFSPRMLPSSGSKFKSIVGSGVGSRGQVQLNSTIRTVAGPC